MLTSNTKYNPGFGTAGWFPLLDRGVQMGPIPIKPGFKFMNETIENKLKRNKVYNMPTTPYSRSAYILLIKQYQYMDKAHFQEWLNFRNKFLEDVLKKNGTITCGYCGKNDLEIVCSECASELNQKKYCKHKNLATIDHIVPLSNKGERYDEKNIIVSCFKCNQKKKSKPIEVFLKHQNQNKN